MLFFDKKLKKVFDLFDNEFYDNIKLPNKIEEFIDNNKWEIINKINDNENNLEELSFCVIEKADELIINIIDELDDEKKCEIDKIDEGKLFDSILTKSKLFKKNSYIIYQNINFPFELKSRSIKCFNKLSLFKKDKKKMKMKIMIKIIKKKI